MYNDRMDSITYTAARATLADTMKRVCESHETLLITRQGAESVVMMSLADYQSLEETAYLLRSPRNAQRLGDAIRSLESGSGIERSLDDCV